MWGLIDLVGWVINQGPGPPPSPCKPHVQKETSEIFSRWDKKRLIRRQRRPLPAHAARPHPCPGPRRPLFIPPPAAPAGVVVVG